jgi:hypothetical protein
MDVSAVVVVFAAAGCAGTSAVTVPVGLDEPPPETPA